MVAKSTVCDTDPYLWCLMVLPYVSVKVSGAASSRILHSGMRLQRLSRSVQLYRSRHNATHGTCVLTYFSATYTPGTSSLTPWST